MARSPFIPGGLCGDREQCKSEGKKNDQNELNEESREKQEVRKKTSNEQRDTQRIK